MAKDPAFLFYSQDFLTGTYLMDNEQIGKYIRLLCLQHQKGKLTEKDMLKICLTYDEDIFCKFKFQDGVYFNQRLKDEAEKRAAYSESRKKNREKAKNEHNQNISLSYDKHMENENENENEIENEDEDKNGEIFENFRLAYPGVKRGFATEFKDFKKHKDWREVLPQLEQALKQQYYAREENRKNGTFVPEWKHLKTYINQRGWEEEINIKPQTNNSNGQKQTGSGFDLQRAYAKIDEMFDRREARSGGGGDN
jgi:hypothetical protein